jgi:hypothetical protein
LKDAKLEEDLRSHLVRAGGVAQAVDRLHEAQFKPQSLWKKKKITGLEAKEEEQLNSSKIKTKNKSWM